MRTLLVFCELTLCALAQTPAARSSVATITRTGIVQLDGDSVDIHQLNTLIERRADVSRAVYVISDKDVPGHLVSQVVSELNAAKPPFRVKPGDLPIPTGRGPAGSSEIGHPEFDAGVGRYTVIGEVGFGPTKGGATCREGPL